MLEFLKFAFAGHQTFPLRQLWPYKAFNYALNIKDNDSIRDAMLYMGVGSNMVDAVRFWAKACGILDEHEKPTSFAELILGGDDALDQFCEDPSTIWLLHWNIAKDYSKLTPLWFIFNIFNKIQFTKEDIENDLNQYLNKLLTSGKIKKLPSAMTLRRDVDTILRSYAPKLNDTGKLNKNKIKVDYSEEASDALFREINIIGNNAKGYFFNRGEHLSLKTEIFAYCYLDFWKNSDSAITVDLNKIAYEAGSPGRILKLDEIALENYLLQLEDISDGCLKWTEQTGLRQVVCKNNDPEFINNLQQHLLMKAYKGI